MLDQDLRTTVLHSCGSWIELDILSHSLSSVIQLVTIHILEVSIVRTSLG